MRGETKEGCDDHHTTSGAFQKGFIALVSRYFDECVHNSGVRDLSLRFVQHLKSSLHDIEWIDSYCGHRTGTTAREK